VKPIHLNLASRPYRDYRPLYAVVIVVSLVTAFLMLNNVETYYRYISETRSTRAGIAKLEAGARQERDRAATLRQVVGTLDLASLNAKARFINARLAERAFSWSTLLDELESVLPDDVRLLSVTPVFSEGPIGLTLQLETKSTDGMIETINRMNADPQFRNPFPSNETRLEGGAYAFGLTVQYLPPAARAAVTAPEVKR
jgi:type IV pilus assembly protein PilN